MTTTRTVLTAMALTAGATIALAAERDVQIRSVNFDTGIIELFNFGATDEDLSGYRFCTHDENQIRQYSSALGFNGVTIEAGTSLFIYFNNDAPAGPDTINRSTLGGVFAQPLDQGPYGMGIYFPPVSFANGNTAADHLQWSVGGVDDGSADERSDEAQSGGLWTDQSQWIVTAADSSLVRLLDDTGGILHGPDDYTTDAEGGPIDNPLPGTIPTGVRVRLEPVASGMTAPNWGTFAPGDASRLFVADQDGILWAVDLSTGDKSVFLDVSAQLVALGIFGPDSFDERGLLGVAFHPDYATNGLLYTYTSEPLAGTADFSTMPVGEDADHHTVITEWNVPNPADPASVVDPASERELVRIDQPQFNHNAGALAFGPDDMLYVALGDGGGADDVDGQDFIDGPIIGHGTGNAKDPSNILGSVIRIDPDGNDSVNGQYGIPADNPFVGMAGFVDEIFAYGVRNPFRMSFDQLNGYLYVADVGQNDIEEVNLVNPGDNLGWNEKEGTFFFDANGNDPGFVTDVDPGASTGLVDPIAQYDHDEGIAIVGGFVYRGTDVPAIAGSYVFGDFAQTFSNDGRLFYLDGTNQILEFDLEDQDDFGMSLLGFGQDADGEVYVMANMTGTPFGATGVVLRIAPPESLVPLADPIPEAVTVGDILVQLDTLSTGLTAPNWGTSAPGDADRLFVADQDGILWAVDLTTGDKTVFLDVSGQLVPLGIFGAGTFDERGLLGVAFHPDYTTNGLLYTYTSEPLAGVADFSTMPVGEDADHHTVITEWNVPNPTDPASVVDPASERELVRIDQPQFNHNAGAVAFGPDGLLYIALGDGGGADDEDGQDFIDGPIIGHGTGNGQDPSNVLGAVLRVDPAGTDSANGQYGIPVSNPFVGVAGFVDEIFAYGFRNPFRMSFDTATGDLYVADVGQNDIEEVNIVTAGSNYGWNTKEGAFFFVPNGVDAGFVTDVDLGTGAGLVDPIAQYDHDEGIAIVGGFVYRGSAIPALEGRYVFGDFAQTFSNDGRLFYLDDDNTVRELELPGMAAFGLSLLGFGQDAAGEIYVLANSTGTPFEDTGVILRVAPVPGTCNLFDECADLDDDGIRDDNCVFWACEDHACVGTDIVFADMGGQFGECAPDGTADGNDRFLALNCFANVDVYGDSPFECERSAPSALNVDAGGQFGSCMPDGVCDGNDAFAALAAFGGETTCSCPLDPAPTGGLRPRVSGSTTLVLVPRETHVRPGEMIDVDVFLERPLNDLRGYQLHATVTGGRRCSFDVVDMAIVTRRDHVFAKAVHWSAFNLDTRQMVAGLDSAGVATGDARYLATFTVRAQRDAVGTFAIDLLADPANPAHRTFIFGSNQAHITVDHVKPGVVTVSPSPAKTARVRAQRR